MAMEPAPLEAGSHSQETVAEPGEVRGGCHLLEYGGGRIGASQGAQNREVVGGPRQVELALSGCEDTGVVVGQGVALECDRTSPLAGIPDELLEGRSRVTAQLFQVPVQLGLTVKGSTEALERRGCVEQSVRHPQTGGVP